MTKKLEVVFKTSCAIESDSESYIIAFIQSHIPELNVADIKVKKNDDIITATITSNGFTMIQAVKNHNSFLEYKSETKMPHDKHITNEKNLIAERLQEISVKYMQATEELAEYRTLKANYENLKEEFNTLKLNSPTKEESKYCDTDNIKDYINEIITAYETLLKVAKDRLVKLKAKKIAINNYKNMINKIKEEKNKGSQLELLNAMKKETPFMMAIALREDNIRVALMGITAVANAKFNKLKACIEEIAQCEGLISFAEEKSKTYEERHFAYYTLS